MQTVLGREKQKSEKISSPLSLAALDYLREMSKDWVSMMSGIASVILAILGGVVRNPLPRYALWVAATLCYILSSFRIWKRERDQKSELQTEVDAHRGWEFQAEFIGASRTVYSHENGNSPSLSVWIQARVHNRNSEPTLVYPRIVSVQLKDTIDSSFQQASIFPGTLDNFGNPEEFLQFEVAGSSTADLLFFTRQYNPPRVEEYILNAPLPITLELGETFGKTCNLTGPMKLRVENQS
jgi:hypothetical protein